MVQFSGSIIIVSPGNKGSQHGLQTFIQRNLEILNQGIHLLVIDLFPPSTRDPQGIHKALWDEIVENDFELPPDLPLTMVSYDAGPPLVAYIEPVAIGGELPKMPLFLEAGQYVELLMEETYLAAWNLTPSPVQELLT